MAREITFPREEKKDISLEVILFSAIVDDEHVKCSISWEALEDHFDVEYTDLISTFRANRKAIEDLASEFIRTNRFEPDGSILIRTGDI